ncbi:glycosyltransferase family 4 protein [Qipengyuania sp. DSG2-2]|uniref:glycosyltransferase family 4 protein n=1 Tax=Qipengyuania sp. DGS2-2 TaxID=3349631 RepID=UPI0036D2FD5E
MIGPFPPPVHGQSAATLATAEMLADAGFDVRRCDTGEGASGGRMTRITRLLSAMMRIMTGSERHIYISANANLGMSITFLLCLLARIRGRALTLHHHAYSYIGARSGWAAGMAKAAGPNAMHLTQCSGMGAELAARYPVIARTLPFSNVGFVEKQTDAGPQQGAFTFGHMSNLTEDKGLGEAVDTLRSALSDGMDARLVVAGPCSDDFATRTVKAAKQELGQRFEYRGPVYGADKDAFFKDLDLFLFPTRYRNETQGIVVLEALSYGVPVAAYGQCCVGETVGPEGGVVAANDDDFAGVALQFAAAYAADPAGTRAKAHRQFQRHTETHQRDLDAITAHFHQVAVRMSGSAAVTQSSPQ